MKINVRLIIALIAVAFVGVQGCKEESAGNLERELQFTLDYGSMEDQLDLFERPEVPYVYKTRLYFQKGFYYISNANAGKVMKFNSYGDLMSMYYNPAKNPKPVVLSSGREGENTSSRQAWKFSFLLPGEIAVTEDEMVLVEDRVAEKRKKYDEELDTTFNRVVLRLDKYGNYLNFIGQEGLGGTPFPPIVNLQLSRENECVVVCRSVKGWHVYWFSQEGELLYNQDFFQDELPLPEQDLVPSIENIYPDVEERKLYFKGDYYKRNIDEETRTQFGVEFHSSKISIYNIETKKWENWVDIPEYKKTFTREGTLHEEVINFIYEFVGCAVGGRLFFITSEGDNTFQLLIMTAQGRIEEKIDIDLGDKLVYYRNVFVSPEGVLTALVANEFDVNVVWWRSDRLVEQNSR